VGVAQHKAEGRQGGGAGGKGRKVRDAEDALHPSYQHPTANDSKQPLSMASPSHHHYGLSPSALSKSLLSKLSAHLSLKSPKENTTGSRDEKLLVHVGKYLPLREGCSKSPPSPRVKGRVEMLPRGWNAMDKKVGEPLGPYLGPKSVRAAEMGLKMLAWTPV